MISSIDGRISCAMVDKISGETDYYVAQDKLNCPSRLTGKVTVEHYYTGEAPFRASGSPVGGEAVHVAEESAAYSVTADTFGTLNWQTNRMDDLPIICLVSEQARADYLAMLRKRGISYIAVGKEKIDLARAMEILGDTFGIKRLQLVGGGNINGGFLAAGLIDEVSLLVGCGVDGRAGLATVFDGIQDPDKEPTRLKLKSVEQFPSGVVWLRYEARNI